jgi:hypothetical protein
MILYLRDPKNSTKKTIRKHELFWQSSKIQMNMQKSIAFLYTHSAQTEKEIRETIPFMIASKVIKYLGINVMKEIKDLFNEHYKQLKREDLPCSWIGRINIVKMAICQKQSTCSMQSPSKFQ